MYVRRSICVYTVSVKTKTPPLSQLKPLLALLLPACAALPHPVQPLFHAVLQVRCTQPLALAPRPFTQQKHWLLHHMALQALVRYSRETPVTEGHKGLIPPSMRPGGTDAAAGAALQDALACHLARRVVPVHPVHCRPPAPATAAARVVRGASAGTLQQLLAGSGGGDGLQRAVENVARALRAAKAAAMRAGGEHSAAARKRLRAEVDDVLAVWGQREG